MSVFSKQTLKDSTTETVVKFLGYMDSVPPQGDAPNTSISMANLVGAYDVNMALRSVTGNAALSLYRTTIKKLVWSVACTPANAAIQVSWKGGGANANVVAFTIAAGAGQIDFNEGVAGGVIPVDPTLLSGANAGDIITSNTAGLTSASYSIIIFLKKDPRDFDKGALVDKASFANP